MNPEHLKVVLQSESMLKTCTVQCISSPYKRKVPISRCGTISIIPSITRGNRTPGSRDATRVATRRSASYLFQLMHMPRGNCAQSIASNGDQKEDKTLLQHSQLRQHGAFWHASVSERQRSRPCGQNLRVPSGTATGS